MHKEHFCDKRNVLLLLLQKAQIVLGIISSSLVCGNLNKNVLNSFDASTVVTTLLHGCHGKYRK